VDDYLKGLKVIFPSKDEDLTVYIKEAMVKRVEKDIYQGRFNYALQFTDIEKKDSDLLQKLIYRFQREYLRKRQLIDS
jgi:c-di-GMP-binding flagellar brake protein YcgR